MVKTFLNFILHFDLTILTDALNGNLRALYIYRVSHQIFFTEQTYLERKP
jgi:hypothetical protein